MDRKKFLITSSLAAFSVSSFGKAIKLNNEFTGDCNTTSDILGPFYRPNAPITQNLIFEEIKGSTIEIKGQVFKSDCKTPIENALVEIWHCSINGDYDNTSNRYLHRAKWFTNKTGHYKFTTILPGKYLNGKQFRPAHVHFRITNKESKELISQIYFKGDPHVTNDPWASQTKAEHRILPIILEDTVGNLTVNFNIYLEEK